MRQIKPTHSLEGIPVAVIDDSFTNGISVKVIYPSDNKIAWVSTKRLIPLDQKGIEVSEFYLSVLENGKYAIFNNNMLYEIIMLENVDEDGKQFKYDTSVISRTGSNEPLSIKEYITSLPKDGNYRILNASQIMLL